MKIYLKKLFYPVFKHFEDIKYIETIRKEEYARGCTDTAIQFSETIKKQNDYINKLNVENMKRIQDLERENLEHEQRLREEYIKRITELETRHTEICNSCKHVTDEERKRINRLQDALAEKLHESDEIFRKLYNHATMISEEHTAIMQSTARAIASKNELSRIKEEMDNLTKKSNHYLTVEFSKDVNLTEISYQKIKKEN